MVFIIPITRTHVVELLLKLPCSQRPPMGAKDGALNLLCLGYGPVACTVELLLAVKWFDLVCVNLSARKYLIKKTGFGSSKA